MGIDRHEAARRGKGKTSGAARRKTQKNPPVTAAVAKTLTDFDQELDRTDKNRTADRPTIPQEVPEVVQDERPPAAPAGTQLEPPPARAAKDGPAKSSHADRSKWRDVRIPSAWLDEFSALTGEPRDSHGTELVRAGLVLLRHLKGASAPRMQTQG